MKRITFPALSILTIIGFGSLAQNFNVYEWETLTCKGEPVARHEAAFIEANGNFYLVGGRRIQEVSIFNPETNTWTNGAKPPVELHHFEGFSYKGNIYAVGVQTGNYPHETSMKQTYIYNPATDTWEKNFDMPEGRVRASTTAKVYKDKLYVACGIIDGHWEGHVKWFDCYDFKTGKWEILPDAPRFRDHATSVICNDKLYLLGGRVTSGSIDKVFELTVPEVDVYDFKTGKWSTLADPVPTQRAGCTATAIGDKIIFTGGESMSQEDAHNQVECLDTKTGKWSKLPSLNTGRHGTQLIWYKKKLYIASGCGHRGGAPELKSIECFSKN
jgi:N-acetylneuraminic acid mutarotase